MKDDGGPAFPTDNAAQVGPNTMHFEGMTLRDWFAGQALAGHCANPDWSGKHNVTAQNVYAMADAMLAAREARP